MTMSPTYAKVTSIVEEVLYEHLNPQTDSEQDRIDAMIEGITRRLTATLDPAACKACGGSGSAPSYEGCGTTVNCSACRGTGLA